MAAQARKQADAEAALAGLRDEMVAALQKAKEEAERERDALAAQLKGQALSAEEEQARQNALRLEEEREKRVAHLQGVAARRIQQMGLARGWSAWLDGYLQHQMHQRMLRQAASRLMRPKLAAAAAHWRRSWEEEQEAKAEAERQLLLAAQQRQRAALEAELERVKGEMAVTQQDGTARADEHFVGPVQ